MLSLFLIVCCCFFCLFLWFFPPANGFCFDKLFTSNSDGRFLNVFLFETSGGLENIAVGWEMREDNQAFVHVWWTSAKFEYQMERKVDFYLFTLEDNKRFFLMILQQFYSTFCSSQDSSFRLINIYFSINKRN